MPRLHIPVESLVRWQRVEGESRRFRKSAAQSSERTSLPVSRLCRQMSGVGMNLLRASRALRMERYACSAMKMEYDVQRRRTTDFPWTLHGGGIWQ